MTNKTDRFFSSLWYVDALGGLAALGVAAGLPLAFALVVVLLHALCCVVQCAFTGGGDKEGAHDVAKMEAREALRDISADGGGGGALVS